MSPLSDVMIEDSKNYIRIERIEEVKCFFLKFNKTESIAIV